MRKGTLVYTPQPPVDGGLNRIDQSSQTISQKPPPEIGGIEGGVFSTEQTTQFFLRPIESIKPGDFVIGHDGKPHRVVNALERHFHGEMLVIKIDQSKEILCLSEYQRILAPRRVQQLTPNGKWSGIPSTHFGRARELRRKATPPERILWKYLSREQLGVKFRRQHPIGPYIADFYTRDCGLVVEVDGEAHHSNPDQIEYDKERDRFMNQLGLQVLRIPARDVINHPENVVAEIMNHTREYVLDEDYRKQWIYVNNLHSDDIIYYGINNQTCVISSIERLQINERIFYLQIADIHSYLTSVAFVHESLQY